MPHHENKYTVKGKLMACRCAKTSVDTIRNDIGPDTSDSAIRNGHDEVSHTEIKFTFFGFDHDIPKKYILDVDDEISIVIPNGLPNSSSIFHINDISILLRYSKYLPSIE